MGIEKITKDFLESQTFENRRKLISTINYWRSIGKGGDLNYLAKLYKTDKWGLHFYTQHYRTHFQALRKKGINLLEIGVGGYESPYEGAGSLRMWKRYFSRGRIFAIDIFDKSKLQESRIKIFQGSQIDLPFLDQVVGQIGDLDIIIDDGSHQNEHVLTTFKHLFPKLKMGGIYVVEDCQTSYWPKYKGDSHNLNNPETIMGFFKSLADGLNHKEYMLESYHPTYFDLHITSIHFYHNLIFVYKGENSERSNILN